MIMKAVASLGTPAMILLGAIMALPSLAQEPAGDLEPLNIELPEPYSGGTPTPYWDPNLEPADYRDRPPYLAPKGTVLVSRGKPVTSSQNTPLSGELKQITDGDKKYARGSVVELESGLQWVQIDLEQVYNIYAILVWHSYEEQRVYWDVVIQISEDVEFKNGVITVYNNDKDNSAKLGAGQDKEYVENSKGRLIKIPAGVRGRYVRLYSNNNTNDNMNHYVEVEVFGKTPAG